MTDPVGDAKEVVRKAHIHQLMEYFREPGQVSWTQEGISKIMQLYDIAVKMEEEDPLGWLKDFNNSHPRNLEIGSEDTRLGNILVMAEIYYKERAKSIKNQQRQLPTGARRDFTI